MKVKDETNVLKCARLCEHSYKQAPMVYRCHHPDVIEEVGEHKNPGRRGVICWVVCEEEFHKPEWCPDK